MSERDRMRPTASRDDQLPQVPLRLNARAWGVAVGLFFGLGLFLATNVLVLRGGPPVGPHLGLLRAFLPGYRVTFGGSLVGFAYAFVIGYGVGWTIGRVYNALVRSSE
jgi:hypothetical protein